MGGDIYDIVLYSAMFRSYNMIRLIEMALQSATANKMLDMMTKGFITVIDAFKFKP